MIANRIPELPIVHILDCMCRVGEMQGPPLLPPGPYWTMIIAFINGWMLQ
jgi:hypothetical protein